MFGMAEATLAVTFPEPGVGMEVDTVDRNALEHERYAAPAPATPPKGTADWRCSAARCAGSSCAS